MPKTVIVTGASRGLGLAITRYILQDGHNVVITARSKASLEEIKNEFPTQVKIMVGDMADFSLGRQAVEIATTEFGQLDGLVINHAVFPPATRISESSVKDWQEHFNVNLLSAVELSKQAIPALRKSKGCILFTSSGAAVHSYSTWGAYGASKAAMNSLGLTIAVEEPDITALSIAPGVVDTQMQKELREVHSSTMDEKDVARFHTLHKEGGLLKPEQPGNVMARLVLDPPKDLSGQFMRWNDEKLKAYQDK